MLDKGRHMNNIKDIRRLHRRRCIMCLVLKDGYLENPSVDSNARLAITCDELAGLIGVSKRTVMRWEKKNLGPPPIRVGGTLRYRLSSVEEWLARAEAQGSRSSHSFKYGTGDEVGFNCE
jgi:predicted DNA-binding transcriptional regulator AlpA